MLVFENDDSNGLNNFFGRDLGMAYPQQNQVFSNTDGRLDTANLLSLENAFNFFHFPMLCLLLYICL